MTGWKPLKTTEFAGYRVITTSRKSLVHAMLNDCKTEPAPQRTRLVFDLNGHGISLAESNPEYKSALRSADIVHADGGFIVTLSKVLSSNRIIERTATTDMIHDFSLSAAENRLSFYLLGGDEETNAACAKKLESAYPGLTIAGRRNGYFSKHETKSIIENINSSKPDILWVGLGKPFEQTFCIANRDLIDAKWTVTCGGCFNFVTGSYARAPQWMQDANLEWIHRMVSRPKQLLWRYAITSPHALALSILRTRAKNQTEA